MLQRCNLGKIFNQKDQKYRPVPQLSKNIEAPLKSWHLMKLFLLSNFSFFYLIAVNIFFSGEFVHVKNQAIFYIGQASSVCLFSA